VTRHLFIVSRQEPGLFTYLSREFSGEPEIAVILDRRQGERRARQARHLVSVNRRQTERRHKARPVSELSTLGYAFVRLA
jgi:hypothetical protein